LRVMFESDDAARNEKFIEQLIAVIHESLR
jgi:hypothetical protein